MEFVILFGVFALLLLIGVPVAFSLLTATVATVLYLALPPIVVFQQMGSDITSVAKACGYDGADAFRAWFRRQCGMAPTQWQQQWHRQQASQHSSFSSTTIE